jgi:hypothetical protein
MNERTMATIQLIGDARRVEPYAVVQRIFIRLMAKRDKSYDWSPPAPKLYESGATGELAIIRVTPVSLAMPTFT